MKSIKLFFKDLFKDQELEARVNQLAATTEELKAAKETAETEKALLNTQLEAAKEELSMFRAKRDEEEQRYNSKEPWVEIKSADFDPVKGFRIELDWNDAFIQLQKESGIKGTSDDEIIQKWLAMMYQHLVEQLEEKVIDNKDKRGTISDFA